MDAVRKKPGIVYDPLYGFIRLTSLEREIIHSPFYQRLRWIRQIGFSSYVFYGAEHSRFGHSIGVMHNAHLILESCGRAVSREELFDPDCSSPEKSYHQSVRLGALMHDLGTFCFSHTIESAYIRFGETHKMRNGSKLSDDHENLGSFIIKNTDYDGGITRILTKYGYDPQHISDLVKGVSPSILANQILHSEIDCDRMDYLLRDAYYTGLKYGSYDRDYLLYHFTPRRVEGHDILTIKYNAIRCVEDFLSSRFSWYSQVVRSPRGAKYDAIAAKIYSHFLEQGYVHKYSDLLEMVAKNPDKFFAFNDMYFMGILHEYYSRKFLVDTPDIEDMCRTLLFEQGARTARCNEFRQLLLDQDNPEFNRTIYEKAEQKVQEMTEVIREHGDRKDWIISDLPTREIVFTKSYKSIIRSSKMNVLLERDPVKITYENGDIKLLTEVENSTISRLQRTSNFIPNVFISESAHYLLLRKGMIEDVEVPL